MNPKKRTILIVAGIIVLVLIELAVSNAYLNYRKSGSWGFTLPGLPSWVNPFTASRSSSTQILALTEPVHQVTGTILKISDNAVTIRMMPAPAQNPDVTQTPENTKPIEFTAHVASTTAIIKDMPPVPYLFAPSPTPPPATNQPVTPPGTGLQLTDLSPGQIIAVTSDTDLRTLTSNEFDTSMIRITIVNAIHGKITAINGNTITLSGTYLESVTPTEPQEFSISVTPKTEISYQTPPDPTKPPQTDNHKLTRKDLKPDMEVTVFINTDARIRRSADALLIQPLLTSELIGDSTPPGTGGTSHMPAASAAANAQTP